VPASLPALRHVADAGPWLCQHAAFQCSLLLHLWLLPLLALLQARHTKQLLQLFQGQAGWAPCYAAAGGAAACSRSRSTSWRAICRGEMPGKRRLGGGADWLADMLAAACQPFPGPPPTHTHEHDELFQGSSNSCIPPQRASLCKHTLPGAMAVSALRKLLRCSQTLARAPAPARSAGSSPARRVSWPAGWGPLWKQTPRAAAAAAGSARGEEGAGPRDLGLMKGWGQAGMGGARAAEHVAAPAWSQASAGMGRPGQATPASGSLLLPQRQPSSCPPAMAVPARLPPPRRWRRPPQPPRAPPAPSAPRSCAAGDTVRLVSAALHAPVTTKPCTGLQAAVLGDAGHPKGCRRPPCSLASVTQG
jgi:hypothetical protein